MMALLLLYPLRKLFPGGRWLGRISSWFHWHIAFGIGGPVLILYHCNFGLGGSNAPGYGGLSWDVDSGSWSSLRRLSYSIWLRS